MRYDLKQIRIFLGSASFIFDEDVMKDIAGVARYRDEFDKDGNHK